MKCFRLPALLLGVLLLFSPLTHAEEEPAESGYTTPPKNWGVAIGLRTAEIPYVAVEDRVHDLIPLFFYEGEYLFLDGLSAGIRFSLTEKVDVALLGRYRFFDIPADYQNQVRGQAVDMGGQLRYWFTDELRSDFEVLIDQRGHSHATAALGYQWQSGRWDLRPYVQMRLKSSGFNNLYYGLGIEKPGAGLDLSAGVEGSVQLYKNLHLIGRIGVTRLEDDVYNLDHIAHRTQVDSFVGVGFFDDKQRPVSRLKSKPFLRLAHGWATPSNLSEIISFNAERDPYNNQLTSIFYGHPLADELFGLPIPVYLTPGLVFHHSSDVQEASQEYVLAFKLFYTIKLPVRVRLGAAEGLSFADGIPYVEASEMEKKGYRTSKLLNFLDFSLGLNLGDLFRAKSLTDLWLGYSIHHRSGIFETNSVFGRIKGGSNYQTVYLQAHF